MSALDSLRSKLVTLMLGVNLREILVDIQTTQNLPDEKLDFVARRLQAQLVLARAERDGIAGLREGLQQIRDSEGYRRAMAATEPLVSVRIASYSKTEELMDVALASVLAQTYGRLEVIIVNDGPNPQTRKAVEGLADSRVRYEEFERRTVYPADPHARWMVAGSPGMNHAASLATGEWIAPLDDDDAFTPDHVEKLVGLAQSQGTELAYGALMQHNLVTGEDFRIFSNPPAVSEFSFQGAIYLRALHQVFRYDEQSWLVEEPGDWNLIRRMVAGGVTWAATEDVVAHMNQVPFTHKEEI